MPLDLDIAGLRMRINSVSRPLLDRVAERFQSYEAIGPGDPEAVIGLEDRGPDRWCERPCAVTYPEAEMRWDGARYEFWRRDFEGTVTPGSPTRAQFGVGVHPVASFETPVRLVTALCGARRGLILLHSSGALFGDGAYVFTALSGGGKTTLLSLLPDHVPLSDEIVALRANGSSIMALSTPFTGGPNPARRVSGPVAAVFFIHKDAENHVEPADRRSAFKRLLRNTLAYVGDPDSVGGLMESVHTLCSRASLRELHFARTSAVQAFLRSVSV